MEQPQDTLLAIGTATITQEHQTKTISEGLRQELNISNNGFSLSLLMNGRN